MSAHHTPEQKKQHYLNAKAKHGSIALANKARKSRCAKEGIAFDLTNEYLELLASETIYCPISGLALEYDGHRGSDAKAHLDRIIPNEGYVQGNVRWISNRANRMKSDNTTQTLMQLLADSLGISFQEIDKRLSDVIQLNKIVQETEANAYYEDI